MKKFGFLLAILAVFAIYMFMDSYSYNANNLKINGIKTHDVSSRFAPDNESCVKKCQNNADNRGARGFACGISWQVCCDKDGKCEDHSITIPFVG